MPLTVRQRTMQGKRAVNKRKTSKGEYIVTSAPSDLRNISYPGGAVALGLLLSARLLSAYWNHIEDCDETYNYWEPLHYLLYGSGFQTWEYSPVYALRSYASLWVFAIPAKIMSFVMPPVSVFYTMRALLAVLTACAELMFYKAVCQEFGVHVGRVWLCFALPAAGCFASASAMLPSSWSAALCTAAIACWWKRRYPLAVVLIAVSALFSWPFTAMIGLPIAIDMLILKREFWEFIKWSAISLIAIMLPMVAVDSWHYGRLVIAPLNIVKYNVFTEHGPSLYGVEPWTYYFVNLFLNFNIVWVLAAVCPALYAACGALAPRSTARAAFCAPAALDLLPLPLWLLVLLLQPHKEERFLYPVYSMILVAGAISVDCALKIWYAIFNEMFKLAREKRYRHYLTQTGDMFVFFVIVAGLLSVARIVQLYNNYHGTMTILTHLPERSDGISYVCYGKDWYRSPSSFHVTDAYRIRFIQSEFKGQMPAPYDEENDTRAVHPYFNGRNKGDSRTYLKPSQCHYLVDSDVGEPTDLEPHYHKNTKKWETIASVPILDAKKSETMLRAFYVPFVSKKPVVYANLYLLKNKLLNA
ncbi:alpha-1,2-mannosyltransferase ALG9 [Epargyreus clarus]|uniref:alpha-1,2-mannosyltransferase ALG9 n=1 Tax=Epargyreus clarus TaxID=520877 RepID=UPI003C2E3C44